MGGTKGLVSAFHDLFDLALGDLLLSTLAVLEFEHAGILIQLRLVVAGQELAVGGEDQVFTGAAR